MSDNKQSSVIMDVVDSVEQKIQFWGALAKYVGWPGLILILLGFGLYRTGAEAWPLAARVAENHMQVVSGLLDTQKEMLKQQQEQNVLRQEANSILTKLSDNQETTGKVLEQNEELLQEIHRTLTKPK